MILDRYIGKIILKTVMMTLFILFSLSGIIKFIEQLHKVGQGNYHILDAGYYTLFSSLKDLEIFFPIATLLGSLLGLGILSQQSELIAMQASGFTNMQLVMAVIKTSIPLIILSILIGEFIAPQAKQMARNYRNHHLYTYKDNDLWIKNGKNFIYIQNIKNSKEIYGINMYSFNDQSQLLYIQYATKAIWEPQQGTWILSQVIISDFTNSKQIKVVQYLTKKWTTYLNPDKLKLLMLKPDEMNIKRLYEYINYFKKNGLEINSYLLDMWKKILRPFSVIVMMLLALSFVLGPLYYVISMGMRVIIGISFGFFFYILDQFFGLLGLLYKLPIALSAILPSVIFLLISFFFLRRRC